ncbi:MAG: Fe-S cluster assembly protein NifU [Cyanobacteria bacterium SID2]|nr:Fe-S cluster assembly protein NifU [Cyanobacteria bacterium SID2]
MWDYSEKVLDLFYNPKNQGSIEDTEEFDTAVAVGEVGSIACGDALRLYLKIHTSQDRILDARFQTFGCTSAIASSSALTELVKGLTLDEALEIDNKRIADYLGGLPEAKIHCSVMGQEALEAAIHSYRGIEVEAHDDDDEGVLVCRCFGITESKILRVVRENNLTDAAQVTNYLKAGGGCGTCLTRIDDLIAEETGIERVVATTNGYQASSNCRREKSNDNLANDNLATASTLTMVQKVLAIQTVIESEVRPVLQADGGDVELHDVDGNRVLVRLTGACGSCPSSTATLKVAIESRLRDRVLPDLIVESI